MTLAKAQSEEPTPYLYYFSDFLNTIVIERADGTDSRTLGEGLMPPGTDIVTGAWSPSGEWFAWRSGPWNEGGNGSYSGWIMSADGTRRLTLLDNLEDVEVIEWSPTEDLLFVVNYHVPGAEGAVFYLIDVSTQRITTSLPLYSPSIDTNCHPIHWMPDGQSISFNCTISIRQGDRADVGYFLRTMSRSGEIRDEPVSFIGERSVAGGTPTFVADNKILYSTPDEFSLVLNDLATSEIHSYDRPPGRLYAVQWSASGDYALLFTEGVCGGQISCADLWLLSTLNHELSRVAESISSNSLYVKLWSPQGDIAYFATLEGDVYLLNAETGEASHLARFEADPTSNDFVSASWSNDGRQLLILSNSYRTLSLADVVQSEIVYSETGDFRYSLGGDSYRENFVFSPDNRYIGLSNQNAVLNTRSNQVTRFITHSAAAYTTGQRAAYNWHPDSEWLVTGDLVFFAGGGSGPWANIVTRVDGTGRRELTKAFNLADWLPDNVIPHLSPGQSASVVPAPALTLVHDSVVNGVAWKGARLAVHTADSQITIWNVNAAGAQQVRIFSVTEVCGGYPIPCWLSWSPDGSMLAVRDEQGQFGIWDPESGALIERLEGQTLEWTDDRGYVISPAIEVRSPDGNWVARILQQPGDPPRDVEVAPTTSGTTGRVVPIEYPWQLQWTPDNRYLVMLGGLGESKILDVQQGLVFEPEDFNSFYGFDISPDGRLLAGASIYQNIRLWDLPTGILNRRLNWYAMAVAFSHDGRYLAAGNSRLVTIWEI